MLLWAEMCLERVLYYCISALWKNLPVLKNMLLQKQPILKLPFIVVYITLCFIAVRHVPVLKGLFVLFTVHACVCDHEFIWQ